MAVEDYAVTVFYHAEIQVFVDSIDTDESYFQISISFFLQFSHRRVCFSSWGFLSASQM